MLAGGAYSLGAVNLSGNLTVAAGSTLSAGAVSFGPADNTMTIVGSFAGSVDGGAGANTIVVSGTAAFASITGVDALRLTGGLTTVSGQASLSTIALAGGRMTGLAGSTISASAITATVSDKLVVNGQLTIAQGATLQIVAGTAVTPGKSLELVTASGGISGSFTNVVKPASLFGFLIQDADGITLMGQFLNDAGFSAPVRGAIDYVNSVLVSGNASNALLAAVPGLVTTSGSSDAAAFALLTPEVYAAASQIAVEQGLDLAATGRSDAFAAHRETPGAFTFASALGSTRTLDSGANGAARTRMTGYGFLGGLGLGSADWSLGAFVGYLNTRQTLFTRAAPQGNTGLQRREGRHATRASQ